MMVASQAHKASWSIALHKSWIALMAAGRALAWAILTSCIGMLPWCKPHHEWKIGTAWRPHDAWEKGQD